MKEPTVFEVEDAEEILEELIERAKEGELIVIRYGSSMVRIEPISDSGRHAPPESAG